MQEELDDMIDISGEMLEICDRMTGEDKDAMERLIYTLFAMLTALKDMRMYEDQEAESDDPMN
jgi:hypothetical protein